MKSFIFGTNLLPHTGHLYTPASIVNTQQTPIPGKIIIKENTMHKTNARPAVT